MIKKELCYFNTQDAKPIIFSIQLDMNMEAWLTCTRRIRIWKVKKLAENAEFLTVKQFCLSFKQFLSEEDTYFFDQPLKMLWKNKKIASK